MVSEEVEEWLLYVQTGLLMSDGGAGGGAAVLRNIYKIRGLEK
jgi:hypothetical protein